MTQIGGTGVPFALTGKRVWVAGHRGMVGAAIVRRMAEVMLARDRHAL